jgi:UDPglucose 6-dehydrogenase
VRTVISEQLALRDRAGIEFEVVSNPEFLKEGDAINDCMRPDRIVIGTANHAAAEKLRRLYAPFNRNHERIVVEMVRQGMGSDPRIGWHFIYPGAGYGGSCFPKDIQALQPTAEQNGHNARILNAVESVNEKQKEKLFELITRHFGGALAGRTFALWGLAFKPNTDDMRAASSRNLLKQLWGAGARVRAYDPKAMDEARRIYGERPDLTLCDSAYAALADSEALVVVTEWKQFRSPDFARLAASLRTPAIFDGRNLYDPAIVEAAGLAYYGTGRGRSLDGDHDEPARSPSERRRERYEVHPQPTTLPAVR